MRPEERHERSQVPARARDEIVARRLGVGGTPPGSSGPRSGAGSLVLPGQETLAGTVPAVIPMPGRHAHRRAWLRVPFAFEPRHVSVVLAVVALALAITCGWLVHRTPSLTSVAGSSVAPSEAASLVALGGVAATTGHDGAISPAAAGASVTGSPAPSNTAAGASGPALTIDVAGRVRRPGVRTLPAGSRVVDALAAAGGVKGKVDLSGLNQARLLVDGEQVVVGGGPGGSGGTTGTAGPGGASAADGGGGTAGGLVNLNTATEAQLDTLPGVGPVTAQAIVAYRTAHGGFGSVGELVEVDGIGEATLAKLEPHVTI